MSAFANSLKLSLSFAAFLVLPAWDAASASPFYLCPVGNPGVVVGSWFRGECGLVWASESVCASRAPAECTW